MQTILVIAIVAAAACYGVWRAYKTIADANDPCARCQGCALKQIKQKNGENKHCKQKK